MMQKKQSPVNIEIPRRGRSCIVGQEEFLPEMEYYSMLVEDPEQRYIREDFCLCCWEKVDKSRGTTSWKARIPTKKETSVVMDLKREEKAMLLLRDALAQGEEADTVLVFVLALYLARRKLLLLRQQVENKSGIHFLYEVAMTEEIFYVKKIDFSKMRYRIDEVQQELAKQLGNVA